MMQLASVRLLVEEMNDEHDSPILFYKAQGEQQPNTCEYLEQNDFAIALQTSLQAEMMKQLVPDKVLCIDSTHGTNGYAFTLVTLLAWS